VIACDTIRDAVIAGLPQVLRCESMASGLRLGTVFEHPDGDLIDMFLVEEGGATWLTDQGEALRHLDALGFDATNTPKKRALFQDALSNLAVQDQGGRLALAVDVSDAKDFTAKLLRLGQAMTRVGDLLFMAREQSPRFFREDVQDFLHDRGIEAEGGPQVVGRSGQAYTFDFRIARVSTPLLIKTLTTGSRAAAETLVSATVRTFYDLSRTSSDEQRVSVVDDSEDVWTPAQLDLLGDLGKLVLWSAPEKLIDLARAA
jgi:hypothetical protein